MFLNDHKLVNTNLNLVASLMFVMCLSLATYFSSFVRTSASITAIKSTAWCDVSWRGGRVMVWCLNWLRMIVWNLNWLRVWNMNRLRIIVWNLNWLRVWNMNRLWWMIVWSLYRRWGRI